MPPPAGPRDLLAVRFLADLAARVEKLEQGRAVGQSEIVPSVKAGPPTDADFASPPPVGTQVLDTTNLRLYVRTGVNVWQYAALV